METDPHFVIILQIFMVFRWDKVSMAAMDEYGWKHTVTPWDFRYKNFVR